MTEIVVEHVFKGFFHDILKLRMVFITNYVAIFIGHSRLVIIFYIIQMIPYIFQKHVCIPLMPSPAIKVLRKIQLKRSQNCHL